MAYLKTKNPTNEQINGYKMTEKRINEKLRNLNEEEWNTKSNKIVYDKNVVMTAIIKCCRSEKKKGVKAIDRFRKKLMSPDCKISECPEFEVKSKLFMNEKILEEYSLRVYEIDPFFSGHHKANFTE